MDFDTGPPGYINGAQVNLESYFKGIAQALAGSGYKIGVYGAGQALQWLTTADTNNNYTPVVSYTWLSQSTGWAGYGINSNLGTTHGWTMIQGDSSTAANTTVPIDPDATRNTQYGAWDSVNISVEQAIDNQSTLDHLPAGFSVTDTASAVAAQNSILAADTHITSITAIGPQTNVVEIYNVVGQTYTSNVYVCDKANELLSARYGGVTGQAYQAFETDYSAGVVTGTQFFYTGITGKSYTTETLKVNAAEQRTAVIYGGLTGQPYSSYEYDDASGLFAGSTFTYTSVPSGATYSSYATNYDFANTYIGASFFYTNITGQPYTGEEVDTTAAGATTKVLLTGYTGQPYQTLELDYTGGTYTGYKTFATGITGQAYTGLEEDVTAAGGLSKVVYTGLKSTPYTTLEQDYTSNAPSSYTFTFEGGAGQSYSSYAIVQNAGGTTLSETVNNTDGSHTIVGFVNTLIFEAIGNDRIKGGGSGETFDFSTVFGHDTITDFAQHTTGPGHDTISLSSTDFTSFAALSASAQTSPAASPSRARAAAN